MNVTLSVDKRLVERARSVARASGTSLNQMIRDYLSQVAGDSNKISELSELRALSGTGARRGWKFNRDELHERA
ncbi:MAG: DUF6364 family protein [Salinisphaera sp.]|nr:DUF6364 family protein [Salinisphaera sp.]